MQLTRTNILTTLLVLILSITFYPLTKPLLHWTLSLKTSTTPNHPPTSPNPSNTMPSRTPVYFLSHGGPNIIEDFQHPAYKKLQEIGKEITTVVKPKAVVVFSAHWQAGSDAVQVNTAEITGLIYE